MVNKKDCLEVFATSEMHTIGLQTQSSRQKKKTQMKETDKKLLEICCLFPVKVKFYTLFQAKISQLSFIVSTFQED